MNLTEYKEYLFKLLARNIIEVFKELDKTIIFNSNSGTDYIQLKSSFSEIERKDQLSIISNEDNFVFKNRIREGLIRVIQNLKFDELKIFLKEGKNLVEQLAKNISAENSSNEFLKKLLINDSNYEYQELILDDIRYQRFKNQVKIFSDAKKLVERHGLSPKVIPLKILTPLIEHSSLEDEESLQSKWSNLIASISTSDDNNSFKRNCIDILSKLSSTEAFFLDKFYVLLVKRRKKRIEESKGNYDFPIGKFPVYLRNISAKGISKKDLDYVIENLIRLGILSWDTPEVELDSSVSSIEDIDIELYKSEGILLTGFGLKFFEVCNFNKSE